jgi:hypothetical protein
VKVAFVGDREHGPKTLQVYVLRADFVMVRHAEAPRGV